MAIWTCVKCNVEMEEVDDIKLIYGDIELPDAEGLRCTSCGEEYLLEDLVVGELNGSEEMLEGK